MYSRRVKTLLSKKHYLYLQCLTLPDKYKRGKLLAYQLLCQMVVQRHTVPLPSELVSQFYLALHQGVNSGDQVINVVCKKNCPLF